MCQVLIDKHLAHSSSYSQKVGIRLFKKMRATWFLGAFYKCSLNEQLFDFLKSFFAFKKPF
jgi:hypothetical protein